VTESGSDDSGGRDDHGQDAAATSEARATFEVGFEVLAFDVKTRAGLAGEQAPAVTATVRKRRGAKRARGVHDKVFRQKEVLDA